MIFQNWGHRLIRLSHSVISRVHISICYALMDLYMYGKYIHNYVYGICIICKICKFDFFFFDKKLLKYKITQRNLHMLNES